MEPAASFLAGATRVLFFTGKGGVGKTSLACASAVSLADQGKRVLLVSTDPASNLDEVLGVALSGEPTPVPGAEGLFALNIDPEAAAKAYRERVVSPYRGLLPDAAIVSMEEQLSGACTVEIAAFDEFTKLLGDAQATAQFDHVIFDTAPTGHTLRLLRLPAAWTGFMDQNTTGASCLGPLSGLTAQKHLYEESLRVLADPGRTTLCLVSRPEVAALREAERSRGELVTVGLRNQVLLLNGVFRATDRADSIAVALERRGELAVAGMPMGLSTLMRTEFPLLARSPMGIEGLREAYRPPSRPERPTSDEDRTSKAPDLPSLASLIDEIESGGAGKGVVMTMGKGGVGKTTVAASIAAELAARGHRVHLSTTDPAAHVADVIGAQAVDNLTVSRIDPVAETRSYTREVLLSAGSGLSDEGRALLEEDLRSPCTEEVAVFRAFAQVVSEGADGFVVLDTAPTGHTLLLLDAAESYHREVLRTTSDMPEAVKRLLPRLRDPAFTRIVLVTLPEATPVHEAARLQSDMERAGILSFGWVLNQSFLAARTTDPVLCERAHREEPFLREASNLAERFAVIPWTPEPPVGPEKLRALARQGSELAVH
ncbi:MAG: arsenical pump-driving ATPase [Bryobacteraceae bacterium]